LRYNLKQELIKLEHISLSKMQELCGENDRNLKLLKQLFEIDFSIRGLELYILDDRNNLKEKLMDTIHQMITHLNQHAQLDERDVIYIAQCSLNNIEAPILDAHKQVIGKTFSNKAIFAKTSGQLRYIEALRNHELIISSGPAGTGKTFLSVVYAVQSLKRNEVQRIVLTRPVVEAGESLGFLPGDLKEKIDPYLRPLYDALHEMLGQEQVDKMIEKGIIEIAPLAYMRGRTFDDAFVILDEAQNTTKKQMLMFLTRMGFRTKMVITGDETQIDLKSASGLAHARHILKDINGIKFVELSRLDIVRHPLVQKIIERYEDEEKAT
jgi:phosphate starvation-inducible protein PhoH and related proteins